MKKSHITRFIAEKYNLNLKQSGEIINDVFSEISEHLASGEKISIVGFGSFFIRKRAARKGRNPQTGESIHLPETHSAAFNPSTKLASKVKKGHDPAS